MRPQSAAKAFIPLPLPECLFYLSMTIGHALFAVFTVYEISKNLELSNGEKLFGFQKDTYDTEWMEWTRELPRTFLALLLHSIVFNLGGRVLDASKHRLLCLIFWTALHFACYSISTLLECFFFAIICLVTTHMLR